MVPRDGLCQRTEQSVKGFENENSCSVFLSRTSAFKLQNDERSNSIFSMMDNLSPLSGFGSTRVLCLDVVWQKGVQVVRSD